MARVALGAGADGAIVVGLADGMALLAACCDCRMSFGQCERIRRSFGAAGLVGFGKVDLLGREPLGSMHGGPARHRVAAAQVFLIDGLVAAAAVPCRQMFTDDEAVVVDLLLAGRGLVAIEAVHTFLGMIGHFVLVDN